MDFGIVAHAGVLADGFKLARECEAAFLQLVRATRRTPPVAPRARARKRRR
jgi:hypothetical protein